MNKRVLIACEESQTVCKALRVRGFEAYSCDVVDCSGGHPDWHIKDDVLKHLGDGWDMAICFPPCTDLAVSGARWFEQKRLDGRQQKSIEFFMQFTKLNIPTAIENPISIMSSVYRKPDQIIQPWMFGHGETKATCLWLFGLPKLIPTNIVSGREQHIWKMPPSETRGKERSKTFSGIAEAMATQWGNYLLQAIRDLSQKEGELNADR